MPQTPQTLLTPSHPHSLGGVAVAAAVGVVCDAVDNPQRLGVHSHPPLKPVALTCRPADAAAESADGALAASHLLQSSASYSP